MLGNFYHFFCRLPTFFKINSFKKLFQEHYQSVKQFESRSGPTFCRSWSGSKLFAKVISRRQKPPLAKKINFRCSLDSDLGLNCLQRLSAASKERVNELQYKMYCIFDHSPWMIKEVIKGEFIILQVHHRNQETFNEFPGLLAVVGIGTATLEGSESSIDGFLHR